MTKEERDENPRKGSLFDDLSATQVIAGALAAVTSMLLASQIGIAGSVIGVGVGSIVSAVASQLYKKFLAASAEKLRDLSPVEGVTGVVGGRESGKVDLSAASVQGEDAETVQASAAATVLLDETSHEDGSYALPAKGPSADKTAVLNPVTVRQSNTLYLDDEALRGDATVLRAKTLRRRKKQLQRRVVAVAAVSALAAVMVSAFLINALTDGQGIGTKVSSLPSPIVQSEGSSESSGSSPSSGGSVSGNGSDQGKSDAPADDANKGDGSDQAGGGSSGSADGETPGGSGDPSDPSGGSGSGSDGGSGTGSGTGDAGGSGGSGEQGSGSGSGSDTGSGTGGGQGSGSGSGQVSPPS